MIHVPKLSSLIEEERKEQSIAQHICPDCGFTSVQHFWQPQANGGVSYLCPDDEETIAFLDQQDLKWTE